MVLGRLFYYRVLIMTHVGPFSFSRNFVTKTMMTCGPFNAVNCDVAKTELKARPGLGGPEVAAFYSLVWRRFSEGLCKPYRKSMSAFSLRSIDERCYVCWPLAK